MPTMQLFLAVAAVVWVLLGLVFFTWLWFSRLKRFVRNSKTSVKAFGKRSAQLVRDSKPMIRELGKVSLQSCALLAPFLIPIIVTAICLFFG